MHFDTCISLQNELSGKRYYDCSVICTTLDYPYESEGDPCPDINDILCAKVSICLCAV